MEKRLSFTREMSQSTSLRDAVKASVLGNVQVFFSTTDMYYYFKFFRFVFIVVIKVPHENIKRALAKVGKTSYDSAIDMAVGGRYSRSVFFLICTDW